MIIQECSFEPILLDSRCFRKGICLQLTTKEGKKAYAEISPLPGHNKETLDDAYGQLQLVKRRLLTTWWSKQALHYLGNWGLYPSVHFGLESALRDLIDPIDISPDCKSYALLLGSPDEVVQHGEEAIREGIHEAKIKLGHYSVDMAKEVINTLQGRLKLRLDLNRKWTLEESLSLCESYAPNEFTYIEEPCRNPEDLAKFPYPFAIDETLRDPKLPTKLLKNPNLNALIVKPTLTYPVAPLLKLGHTVILTSSFEGATGLNQIRRLITRLGLTDTTHGLDTLRYFEQSEDFNEVSNCYLEKATS